MKKYFGLVMKKSAIKDGVSNVGVKHYSFLFVRVTFYKFQKFLLRYRKTENSIQSLIRYALSTVLFCAEK